MKNNHKGLEFFEQSSQGQNGGIGVESRKRFISLGTRRDQLGFILTFMRKNNGLEDFLK
jgi:hypothetical protein